LNWLYGWRDRLVRWGGLALVAAGVLGLVASALFVVAMLRAPEGMFSYAHDRYYVVASFQQWVPRWLLVCVGLAGLYFSLDGAPRLVRRMALSSVALLSFALVLPLTLLLGQLPGSQDAYGATSDPLFSRAFVFVHSTAPSAGIALCGVATLWVRGLGRGRFMLLVLGLLDSPLSYWSCQ
jgi:hypothetical protein